MRIALEHSGLEARSVTSNQMRVILERVLPGELEERDVGRSVGICRRLGGS